LWRKKYKYMEAIGIDDIKKCFPDEWILLGNPEIDEFEQEILSGVVLYHSPDKREVAYFGRTLIKDYKKTASFFNRVTPRKKTHMIASLFCPAAL